MLLYPWLCLGTTWRESWTLIGYRSGLKMGLLFFFSIFIDPNFILGQKMQKQIKSISSHCELMLDQWHIYWRKESMTLSIFTNNCFTWGVTYVNVTIEKFSFHNRQNVFIMALVTVFFGLVSIYWFQFSAAILEEGLFNYIKSPDINTMAVLL